MNPLIMNIIEDNYIDKEEELEIEHLNEFREETLEILEELEEKIVYLESLEINHEVIKTIYRGFHSIKGIAGFASQNLIETIAHNTETLLAKLQNGIIDFDLILFEIFINSVELIKQICKDFTLTRDRKFNEVVRVHLTNIKNFKLKAHKRLTVLNETSLENDDYIRIPVSKMEDLSDKLEYIKKLNDKLDQSNYELFKKELAFELNDIETYLIKFRKQEINYLFKKLSKVAKYSMKTMCINCEIIYEGGEIIVEKKLMSKLFVPLTQIIRNALTHGLYNLEGEKFLYIKTFLDNGNLNISVENNGAEIDPLIIKKKLVEKKIKFEDKNILNAIFLSGFTTRNDDGDIISGRGIGLDIVKNEIEKLKGEIAVFSEKDRGTIFKIKIPLSI